MDPSSILLLAGIALLTSTLTAVVGLGGGLLLIASMAGLLPNQAIVPVHAVVQLFSNLSRAAFGLRWVEWRMVGEFAIGSVLGVVLGALLVTRIDPHYLPLIIGLYILYMSWGPDLPLEREVKGQVGLLGVLQSGLGLIVGATGPMGQSLLMRRCVNLHALICTTAMFMATTHIAKIATFQTLGFQFLDYAWLLAAMIVATTLGSLLGTLIRKRLPTRNYKRWMRILLTLLAIRMIVISLS